MTAARRVLACPASLKGVLAAPAAAAALAEGFLAAGRECDECPVADGGEGTAEALASVLGGTWHTARVSDPLGRPVEARWLELPDGTGVVESAEPLGLPRVAPEERDPLSASSRGLGELILTAGERPLLVCLGGVATVDGGRGLREIVHRLPRGTRVACDVRSTLLDAARLFARQKGASDDDVVELERRLAADTELAPYAELPGAGAAGGLGAALAAVGGELVPGAALVLDVVGFAERLARAGLVVTGEGAVDRTSLEGKAPAEVGRRTLDAGVRCVVFGGRVDAPLPDVETVALSGDPSRAREDLVELGVRLGGAG
ncbi:MAG: glycerate kinase [Actinobacteria bacterium]|nr:MAG: glycerate kinase [Actinomycetota bacterium]